MHWGFYAILFFTVVHSYYVAQTPVMYVFDNVLNQTMCDWIIARVEQENMWKLATIRKNSTNVLDIKYRNNYVTFISVLPQLQDVDNFVFPYVTAVGQQYIYLFNRELDRPMLLFNHDEGYHVVKYNDGQFYDIHIDNTLDTRLVSIVFFLNDNFAGGDLFFPKQSLSIQPKRGRVVAFPSFYTHPHRAQPVINGTKYALVTWLKRK